MRCPNTAGIQRRADDTSYHLDLSRPWKRLGNEIWNFHVLRIMHLLSAKSRIASKWEHVGGTCGQYNIVRVSLTKHMQRLLP